MPEILEGKIGKICGLCGGGLVLRNNPLFERFQATYYCKSCEWPIPPELAKYKNEPEAPVNEKGIEPDWKLEVAREGDEGDIVSIFITRKDI